MLHPCTTTFAPGRDTPSLVLLRRQTAIPRERKLPKAGKGGIMELRVSLNVAVAALSFAFLAAIVFATL